MSAVEWFDDIVLGTRCKSETVQITETDIKRFAIEFDPQPMHLDEDAAAKTVFKGLAASGWHTAAIAMSLATKAQPRPLGPHPLVGIGVDELRWLMPVRPGDILHLEGEIVGRPAQRQSPRAPCSSNGHCTSRPVKRFTCSRRSPSVRPVRSSSRGPAMKLRMPCRAACGAISNC